jgi:nicotinate-nucleotide adenylyltransferase
MTALPRLGLLGGTFDPVHLGHVEAARAAMARLALDRVLLLPSHVPPHRRLQPQASGFHRFAMAALAAQEVSGLEVSDLELRSTGPSYTARTLAALHGSGLAPAQLFFIIGADAFSEIATWFDYPRVLDQANFVVVSRPGHQHDEVLRRAPEVAGRVADARQAAAATTAAAARTAVILIDAATPAVSSTEVRRRLEAGEPIDDLVPAGVARHIARHHLYQPRPGGSPLA